MLPALSMIMQGGGVSSYIGSLFGNHTRTSPKRGSMFVPFIADDGEAFDLIARTRSGFIARSVRTGERVEFAAHGSEAVEVERLPCSITPSAPVGRPVLRVVR